MKSPVEVTPTLSSDRMIIAVVLYDESSCSLWGIGRMFDDMPVPVRSMLHFLAFKNNKPQDVGFVIRNLKSSDDTKVTFMISDASDKF